MARNIPIAIGSNGQCVGEVLVTRTSSNCRGQFMFGCRGGGGSSTITGPKTFCDEIGIPESKLNLIIINHTITNNWSKNDQE